MSDSSDPGFILSEQSNQLGARITNLENQIASADGNIKAWKNERDGVIKAKEIIDANIEKLPKPKVVVNDKPGPV
jgi:hypothetical protein